VILPHWPPSPEAVDWKGKRLIDRDWDVKIIKQAIAFLAGDEIRQISSTLCQMMKKEVGRELPKT
jgi:hypothetical protein